MKYHLLGGYGFIGRDTINKLPKSSEIIVADNSPNLPKSTTQIKYVYLDFTKVTDFTNILEDVDIIFHLVCTVTPKDGTYDLINEIEDNMFSTIRLLDSIVASRLNPKLVFISSGGTVYGEAESFPQSENFNTNPICKYGMYKLMTEKLLSLYRVYHNLDYSIVRLSNPYGSYIRQDRSQGLIPILIDSLLHNKPIEIWGNGENMRDYIYINDAIDAILKIVNYTGQVSVFNVGFGKSTSIKQIIDIIVSELGCAYPSVEYKEQRKCDVIKSQLDIRLIKKELDWQPTYSLSDGIRLCLAKLKRNIK